MLTVSAILVPALRCLPGFACCATTPLPHVDAAIEEVGRALDTLGVIGVNVGTSVAGRPLEALIPELESALNRSRAHELTRGIDAVIDIAVARSGAVR